jgi:hypothetical protein
VHAFLYNVDYLQNHGCFKVAANEPYRTQRSKTVVGGAVFMCSIQRLMAITSSEELRHSPSPRDTNTSSGVIAIVIRPKVSSFQLCRNLIENNYFNKWKEP